MKTIPSEIQELIGKTINTNLTKVMVEKIIQSTNSNYEYPILWVSKSEMQDILNVREKSIRIAILQPVYHVVVKSGTIIDIVYLE